VQQAHFPQQMRPQMRTMLTQVSPTPTDLTNALCIYRTPVPYLHKVCLLTHVPCPLAQFAEKLEQRKWTAHDTFLKLDVDRSGYVDARELRAGAVAGQHVHAIAMCVMCDAARVVCV